MNGDLPAGKPYEYLQQVGQLTPSPLPHYAIYLRHVERDELAYIRVVTCITLCKYHSVVV